MEGGDTESRDKSSEAKEQGVSRILSSSVSLHLARESDKPRGSNLFE